MFGIRPEDSEVLFSAPQHTIPQSEVGSEARSTHTSQIH